MRGLGEGWAVMVQRREGGGGGGDDSRGANIHLAGDSSSSQSSGHATVGNVVRPILTTSQKKLACLCV